MLMLDGASFAFNPGMRTDQTSSNRSASPAPSRTKPRLLATTQVLVVEDHPIFLYGLKQLIEEEADFEVIETAVDAKGAMQALQDHRPDAAIVDIALPGTNGIELVKMMKAKKPELLVLVVSMHKESQYVLRALRAGARGYVMKGDSSAEVMNALRKIRAGDVYISPEVSERLIFRTFQDPTMKEDSPVKVLTPREREVLDLIGRGYGTREIAEQLNMSMKTVETHRGNMREKLEMADSGELVRFAMDWVVRNEEV